MTFRVPRTSYERPGAFATIAFLPSEETSRPLFARVESGSRSKRYRSIAYVPKGVTMLVCFSHLRWDFVWQRPQHLLTRFAQHMPVYVVEEPVYEECGPTLRVRTENDVTIMTPVLLASAFQEWGFNPLSNPHIRALITPYLTAIHRDEPAEPLFWWYYTPMALGAEPTTLTPSLVVFDVMDELAKFRFAPASLLAQEAALMERADLVFTGGPSLFRAREHRHAHVHCFPSGVDANHFRRPTRIASMDGLSRDSSPVIGFYGVIDERIDLPLIAGIADARPDWTLALIGPIAKINEQDLPRRPNIHYLGNQQYADLPAHLATFDVAIMPFARNEATRFISPTKTLEYLAGGKPVVSTPIVDVFELYSGVVRFAERPEAFVGAIEEALTESHAQRARRRAMSELLLARYDWDAIAAEMLDLMREAMVQPHHVRQIVTVEQLAATEVA